MLRDLEDAEAQKRIDAFAEAEILERGLDIGGKRIERRAPRRRCRSAGSSRGSDSACRASSKPCSATAALRTGSSIVAGEGVDDGAGALLGVQHLLPERHRAQSLLRPPRRARATAASRDRSPGRFRGNACRTCSCALPSRSCTALCACAPSKPLPGAPVAARPLAAAAADRSRPDAGRSRQGRAPSGSRGIDLDAHRFAAGHGEVIVCGRPFDAARDADALPDEKRPDAPGSSP